jgi:hypothetical protein
MTASLIRDTYKVWIPDGATRADFPSDHRAVSASFEVWSREPCTQNS